MKNYWPHRKEVNGFSIEKLAKSAKEKMSRVSQSKQFIEIQIPLQAVSPKNNPNTNNESSSKEASMENSHWANRNFDEYRRVS